MRKCTFCKNQREGFITYDYAREILDICGPCCGRDYSFIDSLAGYIVEKDMLYKFRSHIVMTAEFYGGVF